MREELGGQPDTPHAPRVSIITVTYNAELLIERTLESVFALQYPSVEYIVIDGGSTDRTMEIVARHGGRIGHVVCEPDKGIYDAMNKGLARATGDYVWFLNAGDTAASSDCLDELRSASPPPDFLYGDTILVDSSGVAVGRTQAPLTLQRHHMEWGAVVSHQSFLPRREHVSPYDTRLRFIADQKWMVQALSRCSVGRKAAKPLSRYLLGGLSQRRYLACLLEKIRYSFAELGLPVALRVTLAAPYSCLLYTSPSPRDLSTSRMPSSA